MRRLKLTAAVTALCAVGGVTMFGGSAEAAEELPVAVLTIQTLDAFEQANALTSALRTAVEGADGWSHAQLDKEHALLFLISSLDCADPPDAACEQKIGDELKVDRFVWGTIKREGEEISGDLHLWTRGAGSRGTTFKVPVNVIVPSDPDFAKFVQSKFLEVAGPPEPAKVRIKAGSVNGTLFIDGKDAGKVVAGAATVELPPGAHRIRVVADGYEDMETSIDLKVREDREISLMPLKKSGGPDIQKIMGFTTIGLGVAAAGVATYAGVRVMQINDELQPFREDTNGEYRFIPSSAEQEVDGCDATGDYANIEPVVSGADSTERGRAIDLCKEGETMQTMTLAMWPVAGALAGTGVILLATAKWGGDSKEVGQLPFVLVPSFGPTGGGATFSMRF